MIIAEGVTSDYGCNHAEVNAINSIKDPNDLIQSTLYVTLEPCSHFGKTPPCVLLIYKSKIKNVVIGTLDNSSKVNGKGVSFLKEREIIGFGELIKIEEWKSHIAHFKGWARGSSPEEDFHLRVFGKGPHPIHKIIEKWIDV